MDISDQKLNKCKLNQCVIMTNREFLAYAFSSKFKYEVAFYIDMNIEPQEFCA